MDRSMLSNRHFWRDWLISIRSQIASLCATGRVVSCDLWIACLLAYPISTTQEIT